MRSAFIPVLFGMFLIITGSVQAHDRCSALLPQPPRLAAVETAPASGPEIETCALTLRLVDSRTGETKAGLVHMVNAGGQVLRPAELLPRTTAFDAGSLGEAAYGYMDRWLIVPGERVILVPRDTWTVTAFSGLTTKLASATVSLADQSSATLEVPLESLAAAGGVVANVHLHLQKMTLHEAERYGTEVAQADGLDLVFFSYLERTDADVHYISNTFTSADLQRFEARSGVLFGYGEEYRHNFRRAPGYGHVMFLDLPELILPASLGPDIMKRGNDDGTLRPAIEAARKQKSTVLWCHNTRGHEDIPSWVAGLIDGQIIFDSGATGDYEAGFYRYLNIGLRVPVAMGTDWFYSDMAVTVVPLEEPLSTRAWLAALRAGRSYITNGPLLEFSVNGAGVGDTIRLASAGPVPVHARGRCRSDFRGLELMVNGAVAARAETHAVDGGFEASLDTEIQIPTSSWIALRAIPFEGSYDRPETVQAGFNEYGKPLFAHTSPVYVEVGGLPIFMPEAAESLIAELRSSMVTIRHTGAYTDDTERAKVLSVYEAAQSALAVRLGR